VPTNTPIPPTNTPPPPTNTPLPPTNTPAPPTNTPQPLPTATSEPPPAPPPAHCVDINRAGFDELQQIIHIGPDRAGQIINLRAQRPFASVDQLTRVSGIGPARLADIKAQGLACVLP
jgi:competence protein ComEC